MIPFEPIKSHERTPEVYVVRSVTRLISYALHEEGNHVANFKGDLEDMLIGGEAHGLSIRDLKALTHFHKCCVRFDRITLEETVSMSHRQWRAFSGIRRRFMTAERDPATFIASLRAKRAAQSSSLSETL